MERSACTVLEVYRHELSIRNLSESDLQRQIIESDVRSLISTLDDSWFHFGSLMGVKTFKLQEIKSDNTKMADQVIVLLDHLVNCGETYLNFLCSLTSLHKSSAALSKVCTLLDVVKKRKTEDPKSNEQDDHTKGDGHNGQTGHKVTFADDDDDKSDAPSQTSGTASDETITFICGCGECSIDQFLEGTVGCKNPGRSSQFPLLDTSKLDSHVQMELIDQLETEANEMDQEFSSLVTDISLSFENRNVKLEGLKVFLSQLESVKARSTIEADSMHRFPFSEKIQEATTIFDLFIKMTTTWSWFNDQLFAALLKKFGNEEEKAMMTAYEQKLGQFLKRHVYKMPSLIHNPSEIKGFTKFNVKLADKMRSEKASELPKIRSKFARLLEVKSYALILTTIKEGCVELCFLVPEEVKQLFPLSCEAVNEIRNMEWMVLSVKCGDYEECIREEEVNSRSPLYGEAVVHETDDKQSVISGSSGVTGSVSTGVTAATRSTHHESIQSADLGYCGASTTSQANSGLPAVAENEMLPRKTMKHRGIHEVCYHCMLSNPTNEDLLNNICFNTDLHDGVYPIVTVTWDEQNSVMQRIRPIPQLNLPRGFALCNGEWCKGEKCTFAHSELEKTAWNHELNKTKRAGNLLSTNRQLPILLNAAQAPIPILPLQQQLPHLIYDPRQIMRFFATKRDSYHVYNAWKTKFQDRLQRTNLSDEDLQVDLTVDTYQDKFYNLLCFEEMEHIKLLTERCDGRYEFILKGNVSLPKLSYENLRNVGYLNGISGHQLTYATQSSEGLVFVDHENERDICRANILSCNFSTTSKKFYISFSNDDVKELKKLLDSGKSGVFDIEFEVKHGFFNSLHKAIVNLPEHIIPKLLPRKEAFQQIILSGLKGQCKHECLQLNEECQLTALDTIVSASTCVPILVSGPFGCGKTRILARSAFEFIERSLHSGKTTRILICAHHPASTQVYITKYLHNVFKADKFWKDNVKIVRVTRGIFERHSAYNEYFRNLVNFRKEVQQGMYLNERCLVVVTTYMTSLQMLNTFKNANFFTHVLLDEAAQVREPEAVAPLCLATHDAKIVIAGDKKQVGPALEVLGQQAHENGLGISLLERLEHLYLRNGYPATSYLNKLTDNYRSNKSIVHFLSSIFYDEQITTKLPIQLHHKTSFPFVFYCSDVDRVIRAPQEDTFEVEANAVLAQVNFYKKVWDYSELSIIAPTRNQVNVIRKKLKGALSKIKVLPTYLIQGHECKAVFLSTSEPLEIDGKSKDPLKSLCNPFVFNTAISRAQSLVVAVGNPFMLLKIEAEAGNSRRHCWREYLKQCLDKNAIYFKKSCLEQRLSVLSELKESLSKVSHESGIRQKIHSTSLSSENCMAVSPIQTAPSLVSCLKQSLPKKQQTKAVMSYASAVRSGLKEAPVKTNAKKIYSEKYEDEELINVSDDEVDSHQHLDKDLLARL